MNEADALALVVSLFVFLSGLLGIAIGLFITK
jgi:hypothetical protein